MTLTTTGQRNAVFEGVGLGLIMCGWKSVPFDKVRIDLAFAGAWRSWPHRSRFPQVNTDLVKGLDPTWAITRADARKQVWVLYWQQEGRLFRIVPRQGDWSPHNADDLAFAGRMIDDGTRPSHWQDLAEAFIDRFAS